MTVVSGEAVFEVGERVLFRSGGRERVAEVIEDPLGNIGSRYVRIRIDRDHTEPLEMTVVASELRRVESVA